MQLQHERFVMTTLARDERAERDRRRRLAAQGNSPVKEAPSRQCSWPAPTPVRQVPTWNFKDLCNNRAAPIFYDNLFGNVPPSSHGTSSHSSNPSTPCADQPPGPPPIMSRRWGVPPPPIDYTLPSTAPQGLVLRASASPPRTHAATGGGEMRGGKSWAAAAVTAAAAGRRELDSLLVQRIQGIRRLA